jgi:hypothetical protein
MFDTSLRDIGVSLENSFSMWLILSERIKPKKTKTLRNLILPRVFYSSSHRGVCFSRYEMAVWTVEILMIPRDCWETKKQE